MTDTKPLLAVALALACAVAPSGPAWANPFRTAEEGRGYHPIEPDMWVHFGAERPVVDAVLERLVADGPAAGPPAVAAWVRAWSAAGDAALAEARATADPGRLRAKALAAVIYYHTASAPHTDAPDARAALARAGEAYLLAGSTLPGSVTAVAIPFEGRSFTAYLHLPPSSLAGGAPAPLLVMSNGSDMAKETALGFYAASLLPRGVAFLTLDMPGLGGSAAYDVADGRADKLHAAAVAWARGRPEVDGRNVFVNGVSFGGLAAARLFLDRADELDLAGVATICGPLHEALVSPPEVLERLPTFTMDGVTARLGLPPGAPLGTVSERLAPLSLEAQGLLEGPPIDTPILAVATNADPVAPLADLDRVLARATEVRRVVLDQPGHCPDQEAREALVADWITDSLR